MIFLHLVPGANVQSRGFEIYSFPHFKGKLTITRLPQIPAGRKGVGARVNTHPSVWRCIGVTHTGRQASKVEEVI